MNEKAIVFFSRNGSTKGAASLLAERIGADIIELIPAKKTGFIRSGFMASKKKRISLTGDPWGECRDKTLLILGTPVWAGNGTPAINSFLDEADLTDKKVYIFTLQADPRLKGSEEILEYLKDRVESAGGTVSGTLALNGASPGKTAPPENYREKMNNWIID